MHESAKWRVRSLPSSPLCLVVLAIIFLSTVWSVSYAQVQVERISRIGSSDDADAPDFFGHIVGLAVDYQGEVYVLDSSIGLIRVFSIAGDYIRSIGEGIGPGPGEVERPLELDLGHDGLLYVEDQARRVVSIFSKDGTFIKAYHYQGNLSDLAVADTTRIFAATSFTRRSDRLSIWSTSGGVQRAPAPTSTSDELLGAAYLPCIDISKTGLLYYADPHPYRIHVYGQDLSYLGSWDGIEPERTRPPRLSESGNYYYMDRFIEDLKYLEDRRLLFISISDDTSPDAKNDVIDIYRINGRFLDRIDLSELGLPTVHHFDIAPGGLLVVNSRDDYPVVCVYRLHFEDSDREY